MMPVFELKQVSYQFRQFSALSEINLQINLGERVALVGASGAGKSTLIRLLNGTLFPAQGELWVLGQLLSRVSPRRRRQVQRQIGTVYQQFHLVDSLAVIHNVNAGHLGRWSLCKAALSLIYPLEIEAAAKALQRVGIPEKLYVCTNQLSGGQQQRVALARVLVQDPLVILADEPVSSLDPELSRAIMALLRQLVEEAGKTLVVSLHSIDLALRYCDRIVGLREGSILFDLPTPAVTQSLIEDLYRLKH